MQYIVDVPYIDQEDTRIRREWQPRACGVACLAMVCSIGAKQTLNPSATLEKALSMDSYIPNVGWSHDGLCRVASALGTKMKRREYRESLEGENPVSRGMCDIVESVHRDKPVIVSVEKGFRLNDSSHLVVIVGVGEDAFFMHDPFSKSTGVEGKNIKVDFEKFVSYWRGLAIFVE